MGRRDRPPSPLLERERKRNDAEWDQLEALKRARIEAYQDRLRMKERMLANDPYKPSVEHMRIYDQAYDPTELRAAKAQHEDRRRQREPERMNPSEQARREEKERMDALERARLEAYQDRLRIKERMKKYDPYRPSPENSMFSKREEHPVSET